MDPPVVFHKETFRPLPRAAEKILPSGESRQHPEETGGAWREDSE